jgi:hypothetical protein
MTPMTPIEWFSAISALGIFLNGAAAVWAVQVSKQSLKVSTENKAALMTVTDRQITNRTDMRSDIQGLKHDFSNGLGDHLADRAAVKTVEKMKPVLVDAGNAITDQVSNQVSQTAEKVAAVLADRDQPTRIAKGE